jgi:hypothetical protein
MVFFDFLRVHQQLNLVKKTQEIYYNARKASDRKGFRRINGDPTFLVPRSAGLRFPI